MQSPLPNNGAGYLGFQTPNTAATPYGAHSFVIKQLINQISTATVVQVVAVTNSGGVSPVGFVDVIPQVNQVDGNNNAVPHGTIYHCPYMRIQGGANAIILDPQVGDLGVVVFADRDISSVVANKAQSNPGSRRRFDWADAIYLGGLLNGVPTQYVEFSADGINVTSPTAITLTAPTVTLACQVLAINATDAVNVVTPSFNVTGVTTLIGATTIIGTTTLDGPIAQTNTAGGGTTATMIGPLSVTNDVTIEGKSFIGHVHVADGSDTGPPV